MFMNGLLRVGLLRILVIVDLTSRNYHRLDLRSREFSSLIHLRSIFRMLWTFSRPSLNRALTRKD
jgi:hypothetical protein